MKKGLITIKTGKITPVKMKSLRMMMKMLKEKIILKVEKKKIILLNRK